MNTESNTPEMGLDAAADAVRKMLDPQADTEPKDAPKDEAPQDTEQEAPPQDSEGETEPDESQPKKYRVKVDGEEIEVEHDELLKGYQRQADYTRKAQSLAEQRQQIEAQAQQQLGQYSNALNILQQQLHQQLPKRPPESLFEEDPIAAIQQERAYQSAVEKLNAVAQERQRVAQIEQAKQESQFAEYVEQQRQELPKLIPAWKDEKVATAEKAKVREFLESKGFTRDEITQAFDARAVAIALDAMRFRELVAKQTELKAQPSKTVAPGPSRQPRVSSEQAKQFSTLKQSGRPDDAAALIKSLLS